MPGVRLQHPSLRNCTYTLIHEGRPIKGEPNICGVCGYKHFHKTYHLGLDALGGVTVSETVYARLQEAGLDELQAVGVDQKPEPIRVEVGKQPTSLVVVSRERGNVTKGS